MTLESQIKTIITDAGLEIIDEFPTVSEAASEHPEKFADAQKNYGFDQPLFYLEAWGHIPQIDLTDVDTKDIAKALKTCGFSTSDAGRSITLYAHKKTAIGTFTLHRDHPGYAGLNFILPDLFLPRTGDDDKIADLALARVKNLAALYLSLREEVRVALSSWSRHERSEVDS